METQEVPIRQVNLPEADVHRVVTELEARPDVHAEGMQPTQEHVRQALVAVLPQPVPTAAPVTQTAVPATGTIAQQRVDTLVQMAVAQGIDAAHAAASADEPFVLDALHDALAGALYDQLKSQGRI